MTRFEDVIERDGRLVYTNVGDSMRPLIRQDRDILIIESPTAGLKNTMFRCISVTADSMCFIGC